MTAPRYETPWLLAVLALLAFAAPAAAQESAHDRDRATPAQAATTTPAVEAEAADAVAPELDRLRRRVEENWRVVPLQDGLVLIPRRPGRDLRGVELRGASIAIDGELATGEEVRRRLGSDAEAILSLSYLSPDERATLWNRDRAQAVRRVERTRRESPASRDEWRSRGDRVRIGGDITVQEGERVQQVVTIFGSSTIRGEVRGDVVAVFGNVRLEPTARVQGDVTTVGGRIEAAPGAQFQGGTHQVSLDWPHVTITPFWEWPGWPADTALAWLTSMATFSRMLLVFLVVLAAVALAPGRMVQVGRLVESRPLASFGLGLLAQLLAIPLLLAVTLALLISIVGIPLLALIPVIVVAGLIFWVGGFAATMVTIGRKLAGQAQGEAGVGAAVIGLGLIWALTIVARLWWLVVGTASGPVLVLSIAGAAVECIAWSIGLGAALLAWRERRRSTVVASPEPVVPQPPPALVGL